MNLASKLFQGSTTLHAKKLLQARTLQSGLAYWQTDFDIISHSLRSCDMMSEGCDTMSEGCDTSVSDSIRMQYKNHAMISYKYLEYFYWSYELYISSGSLLFDWYIVYCLSWAWINAIWVGGRRTESISHLH